MRAVTSEVVAAILAVSIPAIAMAQGPLEAPMVAHNPTQLDRQGADARQLQVAEAYIEQLNEAGVFDKEAQVLIERWRRHYNRVRPHSALGYRSPAPAAILLVTQNQNRLTL